jgi:hypothetical protein
MMVLIGVIRRLEFCKMSGNSAALLRPPHSETRKWAPSPPVTEPAPAMSIRRSFRPDIDFFRISWNETAVKRLAPRAEHLMKELKTDDWSSAFSRELQRPPAATLEKIGKQLEFKFAKIVTEPLPTELQDLLIELEEALSKN